ncbi:hypothetical protein WOLCODRAFT_109796 [Wolfiporia cocos MD-104 SS10]|uniref:Uncharacterized protein n=1 Tax=Wolfiporia cocos (strain MD-104) TaxID=742152 RepID=A0A2H3JI33_WOLCO|nr:hypothetical protein WOLCODRAFT_109796 [Wolfiporia cocos MD-104 SS10]
MPPRPSGGKIIIKPRRSRAAVVAPLENEDIAVTDADELLEADDSEIDVGEGASTSVQTPQAYDDDDRTDAQSQENEDVDMNDAGSNIDYEDAEDPPPTKRVRGRPRGRPRTSGTSTPRQSARGRGRGRGKGKTQPRGSIILKLPKLTEDKQDEVAEDVRETPEGGEEEVMGGGKPFRRIQGKVYIIEGDEYVTEDDPAGDTKIDVNGNLQGGRRFKAQTFTIPTRHPERKYMLAIDAARTSGFRDSLYYFRRNPLAMKLIATQAEKELLIEAGKLGSHLRTRSVTLITARSAYKLHGSRTIVDGKWVVDDYYEDRAREEAAAKGLKPGDPACEPQDTSALASEAAALGAGAGLRGEKADRGGSGLGMYRAGGPTTIFGGSGWGPYSDGPLNAVRKSLLNRDGLNEENWMFVAAQRAREADGEWARLRKEALKACGGILEESGEEKRAREEDEEERAAKRGRGWDGGELPMGVYEPHSGIVLYRSDTQPTRSRWEPLPDDGQKGSVLRGTKAGSGAWALAWVDTVMELPREDDIDDEHARARAHLMHIAGAAAPA